MTTTKTSGNRHAPASPAEAGRGTDKLRSPPPAQEAAQGRDDFAFRPGWRVPKDFPSLKGKAIVMGADKFRFCPYCGTRLPEEPAVNPKRLQLILEGAVPWPRAYVRCCTKLSSQHWDIEALPDPEAAVETLLKHVGMVPIHSRRLVFLLLWDHGIHMTHMSAGIRNRLLDVLEMGRRLVNEIQNEVEIVDKPYGGRHSHRAFMAVPKSDAINAAGDPAYWSTPRT